MKGAVYEKQYSFSHDHELRVEKEHVVLARCEILVTGTAITVGRVGKCNYPITTGKSLVLETCDLATLYIQGDGNAEVVNIIGTEE